jgi:hypothetical protein
MKFLLFAAAMFTGMIACLEIGRLVGKWRMAQEADDTDRGISAVDGAVFALFGLLLAFTFSGAASRFDHRRTLITQEANAIGTAYLRIDLLPAAAQPPLRELFREYVQARIDRYKQYANEAESRADYLRGIKLQGEIWRLAVEGVNAAPVPTVAAQLLPALNDMIDITTERLIATQTHPPKIIFFMLFGLAMVVSLLAGHGMSTSQNRQWLHVLAFATAITATVYVIIDVEYPRSGLIRIDPVDQLLVDVLETMKGPAPAPAP